MKLGFITSILDQYGYEQMIDTAAEMGFSCVEVACWPMGKPSADMRVYAISM